MRPTELLLTDKERQEMFIVLECWFWSNAINSFQSFSLFWFCCLSELVITHPVGTRTSEHLLERENLDYFTIPGMMTGNWENARCSKLENLQNSQQKKTKRSTAVELTELFVVQMSRIDCLTFAIKCWR